MVSGAPDWWLKGKYIELIDLINRVALIDQITKIVGITNITNIDNITSVDLIDAITNIVNLQSLDLVDRITLIDTITTIGTVTDVTNIANLASLDLIDRITLIDAITNIANIASVDLIDRITLIDAITNIANIASVDLIDRITLIDEITKIGEISTIRDVTLPQAAVILNHSFEQDFAAWTTMGSPVIDDNVFHLRGKSCKFPASALTQVGQFFPIPIKSDWLTQLLCWTKGASADARMSCNYYYTDGSTDYDNIQNASVAWVRNVLTPTAGKYIYFLWFTREVTDAYVMYLDDILTVFG